VTVQLPSSINTDWTTLRPLYLLLHGRGTLGAGFQTSLDLVNLENQSGLGAIVLAPEGTVDGTQKFWDASESCCDSANLQPDDSTYLTGLIDQLIAYGWPIDQNQIWIVGYSNGGFMGYRMICEHADKFVGLIQVAGQARSASDAACTPSRTISILDIHGTSDTTISYTGGTFAGMPDAYVGTRTAGGTLEQAKGWNGCSGAITEQATGVYDHDTSAGGNETDVWTVGGCPVNGTIEHWEMNGTTHGPTPATTTFASDIDGWARAHPRQ
jgi:polyhydroxybutyrate depolymerase